MQFDWDKNNEEHIARHDVNRVEVEQVLLDPLGQIFDSDAEGHEERYLSIGSTMNGDKIVVPNFANEAEEAEWWFEHRDEHGERMTKAMEEGRTTTLKHVLERHGAVKPGLAVEIDLEDVTRAGAQAQALGIDYEDYMRELLHEALVKNEAA